MFPVLHCPLLAADPTPHMPEAAEFHKLGFPELFEVSAEHGLGVAELMDAIAGRVPEAH